MYIHVINITTIYNSKNIVSTGYTGAYRYGFNGMEKDDEVKGKGNSYDFGARMLDPRVGRWLSIDPLSFRQPDQSTYKAMLNNPIYWNDPNGETEYETVIIKDEKTGKTLTFSVAVSAKIKTDGHVYKSNALLYKYQNYYSYQHVTRFKLTADGRLERTHARSTELIKKSGVKMEDALILDDPYPEGNVYDPNEQFEMAGGFYMTGANGEGTKYFSKNADYVGNIDLLLGSFKKMSKAGKGGKWELDKGPLKILQSVFKRQAGIVDRIVDIHDEVQKVKPVSSGGGSEDNIPGNKNTLSNTSVWAKEDGRDVQTIAPASRIERKTGDTLDGVYPHKHVEITPKGDTIKTKPKF